MSEQVSPLDQLTDRELEVLSAMAEGLSNKEIAEKLFIGFETVRWYARQIYRKLDVSNRTQAANVAHEAGLFDDDDSTSGSMIKRVQLPIYQSQFVGRQQDIKEIVKLLSDDRVRIVTITGPGGIGKTRLAVEVARYLADDFDDGVYFIAMNDPQVELEQFSDTLQRTLKLDQLQSDTIHAHLETKTTLLLFDNFEQSIEQNQHIADLLEDTQNLKILVTSQVPIDLRQEWLYRIEGLSTQNYVETYSDAVALFLDRVERVTNQFQVMDNLQCIRTLCELLNGYPLAIELAATWVRSLTCQEILNEIQNSMDILSSSAPDLPERHRSIFAVFEYAWHLLSDDQKRAMRRLSVFQSEFGMKAAGQVAGVSAMILASLVDRSLIYKTQSGVYRIHSLLRQYALDKLKSNNLHEPQSNVALAIHSLISGQFDRVEQLATELLSHASDEYNLDKGFALALLSVNASARGEYEQSLQLGQSSTSLTRELPIAAMFSYLGLSMTYCGKEDYVSAQRVIHFALESAQTLQTPTFIHMCLPVVSIIHANSGQYQKAIMIYSYTKRPDSGLPHWMHQWDVYEKLHDDLQETLSDDAFQSAWQQGSESTLDTLLKTIQ